MPCFREDGERGTVTGGLGFQCRRLLKGTGVSPSATRGTGWSEETWGWQDPTFHCRNHLPGPAHPLTPLCSVKTLLCENCARVAPLEKKKSTRARRAVQVLILWCACVGYAHTCFLRGGRNSWFQKEVSHYQQEHRLACLPVKNKAVCSLLELHSGLASRRKRVLSVLTQHMRFADICSTTDASSAALKPIVSLCC